MLSSCSLFQRRPSSDVLVSLEGHYLYRSDIALATSGLTGQDSLDAADAYIRRWAENVLLYSEANAAANQHLEEMVESYRRSLYVHEFEQRYVGQHMPRVVADSMVEQFYDANQQRLVLRETILRGVLLVMPNGAPDRKAIRHWMEKPAEHLEEIEKYAYANCSGYELFLDSWQTANQVLLRMPFAENDLRQQLRQRSLIEMSDSVSTYLLFVSDKYFVGEAMPLSYARPEIEKIILSDRQQEYLQRQRDALYRDAVLFGKIRFYED